MLNPAHKAVIQKYISSHNGKPLDQAKMLKGNDMVRKVMLARLLSMTDEQQKAIAEAITPDNIDAFNVLLPGLAKTLERKQNATAG
jgi:hypothetical protein